MIALKQDVAVEAHTLGEGDALYKGIPGVAFPAVARVRDVAFEEAALFTHKGLSGPAILQVSSYWAPGEPVALSVLPDAAAVLLAVDGGETQAKALGEIGARVEQVTADVIF